MKGSCVGLVSTWKASVALPCIPLLKSLLRTSCFHSFVDKLSFLYMFFCVLQSQYDLFRWGLITTYILGTWHFIKLKMLICY